jgi:Leucine-rich repeat (LRR) protein
MAAEIGQLRLLEELSLDHNRLTRLPAENGQLTALTYLNLSGNQGLGFRV